jgi:hypothetical protein
MDKTVQDYLVGLRKEEISENDKKRNLQWTQDFVSMALSSIGSQVMGTVIRMNVQLGIYVILGIFCKDVLCLVNLLGTWEMYVSFIQGCL